MGTSFEYSKTLAMEGSILLLLGLVPYVGWVLGIIGVVLLLRSMKEFANYYQDREIYQNAFTGVKYYIVALIALAVSGAGFIVGLVVSAIGTVISIGNVLGLMLGIAFLVIAFVFYLLAAVHLRKTFNTLAQKTGEASFTTAGTMLWVGSILSIIIVLCDHHRVDLCHSRLLHHEGPTGTVRLWLTALRVRSPHRTCTNLLLQLRRPHEPPSGILHSLRQKSRRLNPSPLFSFFFFISA
jgi:uncharacterized membrane protein